MAEPPEETVLYVEHRYVCSECSHLSASLEDALLHQQRHLPLPQHQYELVGFPPAFQTFSVPESSQYQCLECGQLLLSPGQLLEHQEMHLKLIQPQENDPSPVVPSVQSFSTGSSGSIHYECPECKSLFSNQEIWLAHRQNHRVDPPPPPPALVDLEHSYRKQEEDGSEAGISEPGGVQLLLYECGECFRLFQNPKEFLEHQAIHLTS
ncbi:ZN574 protein, partial [Rhynochetos jubatus]|nr:ZN574 protein [Rhynochetos jubatus]